MDIHVLRAFSDNYVFVLQASGSREVAVVDPGEARPVEAFLSREGLTLGTVLLTHHHRDHSGGVRALREQWPHAEVVGFAQSRARELITRPVNDGESLTVCGRPVEVMHIPAHTLDHLGYYFPVCQADARSHLFAGDTVFPGSVGNLFEGTPEGLFAALQRIRALPAETSLWYAHEYSVMLLREAVRMEPWNERTRSRLAAAERQPSIPGRLAEEVETNPFFHWDLDYVVEMFGTNPGFETFSRILTAAG